MRAVHKQLSVQGRKKQDVVSRGFKEPDATIRDRGPDSHADER